jgi:hypothetical protein
MQWHRALSPGDVRTAHQLLGQHAPYVDPHGVSRCANALHAGGLPAPRWPCARARWAYEVLAAEERGDLPGTEPGDVQRIGA